MVYDNLGKTAGLAGNIDSLARGNLIDWRRTPGRLGEPITDCLNASGWEHKDPPGQPKWHPCQSKGKAEQPNNNWSPEVDFFLGHWFLVLIAAEDIIDNQADD